MKTPICSNANCSKTARVILHGFYKTKSGRCRRYRCTVCGTTFCSRKGTPYYRIQHRRSIFDEVVALSVEGVNKSAISRVKRVAWNTVDRWLEKAAMCCRRFNDETIKELQVPELQADEIRTFGLTGWNERISARIPRSADDSPVKLPMRCAKTNPPPSWCREHMGSTRDSNSRYI